MEMLIDRIDLLLNEIFNKANKKDLKYFRDLLVLKNDILQKKINYELAVYKYYIILDNYNGFIPFHRRY